MGTPLADMLERDVRERLSHFLTAMTLSTSGTY